MRMQLWTRDLREWQANALDTLLGNARQDFLLAATPGCGKTTFTLRVAHELLRTNQVGRVVVVCPTDYLKRQWAVEAATVGVRIDPNFTGRHDCSESRDMNGVAVTYASLASTWELHRRLCTSIPTFAVFDEIHHVGRDLSWGVSLRNAFVFARRRLGLSGTMFRHDDNEIPFVRYDEHGRSIADFSYSYSNALDDRVCHAVYFPSYEGEMQWRTRDGDFTANFRDELNERDARRRLRTALDPDGQWLPQVLREAHERLRQFRHETPDAAGLVTCGDQHLARQVAKLLWRHVNVRPVLAISDNARAGDEIESFKKSRHEWIVTCRMVSEGVDIPRLRVGVFATNILTEMFFRQFVGRFVRGGRSEIFIPREPMLIAHARAVQEERNHHVQLNAEESPVPGRTGERPLAADDSFTAVSAKGAVADDVVFRGGIYQQPEIARAADVAKAVGFTTPVAPVELAAFVRAYGRESPEATSSASVPTMSDVPLFEQRNALRREVHRLVGRYCRQTGLRHEDVNRDLMVWQGCYITDEMTIEQLEARRDRLNDLIRLAEGVPS